MFSVCFSEALDRNSVPTGCQCCVLWYLPPAQSNSICNIIRKVVNLSPGKKCFEDDEIKKYFSNFAVYRIFFGAAALFVLFMLIMLCVRSSKDPRAKIQNGYVVVMSSKLIKLLETYWLFLCSWSSWKGCWFPPSCVTCVYSTCCFRRLFNLVVCWGCCIPGGYVLWIDMVKPVADCDSDGMPTMHFIWVRKIPSSIRFCLFVCHSVCLSVCLSLSLLFYSFFLFTIHYW